MSEPTRLLDGDLPADIAAILQSAHPELTGAEEEEEKRRICATAAADRLWAAAPPPSMPRRTVAWIGLAVAVLCTGAAGIHYGGTPIAADGGATQQVGLIANTDTPATPASEPEPPAPVISVTESEPPVAAPPSMRVDQLPSARTGASSAPSSPPPPVVTLARTPSRPTPNVADELALIDAARAALTAGQPDSAYSHIQRYRASFPTPHFVNEADALEVQALAALGRSDEATTKAKHFLEAHPRSPYTQRVRAAAGLPSGAADTRH